MSKFFITLMLLVNTKALAGSLDYTKLQMKDLDQMRALIEPMVADAKLKVEEEDTEAATELLRDALKNIFSRPDSSDNMVSKLIQQVRPPLHDLNAFEDTVFNITTEAIFALTKGKETARQKASNVFLLQNIMSEFKPQAKTKPEITKIYEAIRDAKIEIPKDVKNELTLRGMMNGLIPPSETALKIIGKKQ